MTDEEKLNYWLELAQYDLDTASAMFSTGRWFYVVFMCQQAIEKCCEETLCFFDTLSSQYITYRYPDFGRSPGQQTGQNEAEQILAKTREVFSWLLTLKPSTE